MPSTTERITIPEDDRFSRLRLLSWWDQKKIAATRVLVVGAGALGNEILKNLALLGFEQIVIVDLDAIEHSNLSRTVLYRAEDIGRSKAETAAAAVRAILPSAQPHALHANVVHGVGLGVFAWADVILAGLDNREARLWINRAAWLVDRPWIDGAIEGLNGVARVFVPGQAPCYECTLGETDWQILERRMSCNMLTRAEMESGKVPTTPTIASIIAGIQVQEAVKLIHGLPTLAGKAFVFEGLNHTSYRLEYTENQHCMSHHCLARIERLLIESEALTLHQLWERACKDLHARAVLEFSRDIIHRLSCPKCGQEEELLRPLGSVSFAEGRCPVDQEMRIVTTAHNYTGKEPFGERRLAELGLPRFDVFTGRTDEAEIAYLIAGDAEMVLGALADRTKAAHL
jgi:molybdopterin/thiamine biosynthesis adenylyltransferase